MLQGGPVHVLWGGSTCTCSQWGDRGEPEHCLLCPNPDILHPLTGRGCVCTCKGLYLHISLYTLAYNKLNSLLRHLTACALVLGMPHRIAAPDKWAMERHSAMWHCMHNDSQVQ